MVNENFIFEHLVIIAREIDMFRLFKLYLNP